ncbi:MAG: replication-associated recombination protein A [Acidimicrobiales bacterium]|nr:replication-associated recombination protein A [Acidimicrobiales bacterium]
MSELNPKSVAGSLDLFESGRQAASERDQPLAARLRPRTLDEFVGQDHILGHGRLLRRAIQADQISSLLFYGPPGTGKTTLALVIANTTRSYFITINAVLAGVADIRKAIAEAKERRDLHGHRTILFIDEVHRFNKAQQDALLPSVESGLLVLVGATTENPYFEVNPPLLSRSTLFRLEPLDVEATHRLLCRGLGAEEATATDEALDLLVDRAAGDGRLALTSLEVAVAIAAGHEDPTVTFEDAEAALGTKAVRYGRDEHYDVISAFIKSIRGSDPDAGLYWLARMLEAGEEARFIARRLVILASEDIGMADPMALVVADAAARAVEFVGLPEARLNLAQAVVHLATAPKSNRVYRALAAAAVDARAPGTGLVPPHLRDAHYKGAAGLGHGDGYDYPHDDPRGWVEQAHRPEEVEGNVYYEPSPHGHEAEVARRLAERSDPEETP